MLFGRHFLIGLALIFSSSSAMATIKKEAISSHFRTVKEESAALFHVYSGKTSLGCTGSGDSPCNSCKDVAGTIAAQAPSFSCNETEVYNNLKFTIVLSSPSASAYISPVCANLLVAIPPNAPAPINSDNTQTYTLNGTTGIANQQISATFNWSKICANSTGADANCTKSFKSRWQFGFVKTCGQTSVSSADYGDTLYAVEFHHRYVLKSAAMSFNNTNPCNGNTASPYENVCHYRVFPGDEKVYMTPLLANNASSYTVPDLYTGVDGAYGSAADPSEQKYAFLRVYWIEGAANHANIPVNTEKKKDLLLDGTNLADSRVDGLVNGQDYAFVAANVDQGGNITHFAIPNANAASSTTPNDPALPIALSADIDGTGQAAIPQPVSGLLDGKNCFVATAAYGSDMAPQVEMLRQFRSQYLLKNSFGKSFVQSYYKYSPAFADWIAQSEFRRAVARTILQPVVFLADVTMASGLGAWSGLIAFVFGVLGLGVALAGSLAMAMVWGRRWLRAR